MTYYQYPIKPFVLTLILITIILPIGHTAYGEILFEAYSQILSASKPAGYIVQRYEHDSIKKELISKYYIQTSSLLGHRTETLFAKSTENFHPLYYKYTERGPKQNKTIEAHFKDNIMSGYLLNGEHQTKFQQKLPKGAFLSTFLGYLMLNKGYKEGVKFTFTAISEEDGKLLNGESYINKSFQINGFNIFRISNKFKGTHFISLVNEQGEVLSSHSPLQKVATQMTSFKVATSPYFLDQKGLKDLFGDIPKGKINIYAQESATKVRFSSQNLVHQ